MLSSRKLSAVLLVGEDCVYSEKYFPKSGACVSQKNVAEGEYGLSSSNKIEQPSV